MQNATDRKTLAAEVVRGEAQTPHVLTADAGESAIPSNEWLERVAADRHLTPKGRQLAHFIAVNPRLASFASAAELAAHLDVNPATVVRFAQALGFKGWPDFQLHFRHRYLSTLLPYDVMHERSAPADSAIRSSVQGDIENLHAALASVDFAVAEEVAQLIAEAERTLVVSSGSYAAVGGVFAHLATFMGYNVHLESHSGSNLVASFAPLRPGDCLLAISFWRLSKQIVQATEYARGAGLTTIAITDSLFSPLARAAERVLIVPTETDSLFHSMTAALSVIYGLLARLQQLGGDEVEHTILEAQRLYGELDVLYT